MKKVLFFAVFTVFAFTSTLAQDDGGSSDGVSFGVKAGVNFSSLVGDDTDGMDGRTGLNGGAVVSIPVSELFAVQPEVVYSAQGFTVEDMGFGEGTGHLDYLNIPILADFTVAEGFSLQAGPEIGFVLNDDFENDAGSASMEAESFNFSIVGGVQYRLPVGLFFQARYAAGLIDVQSDFSMTNSVFSVCAGWFFN
jgi:hypothetical protein